MDGSIYGDIYRAQLAKGNFGGDGSSGSVPQSAVAKAIASGYLKPEDIKAPKPTRHAIVTVLRAEKVRAADSNGAAHTFMRL